MTPRATISAGQILPSLIREAYPRDTAKRAAIAANVPHETARNWCRGRASPSLPFLLRWASTCDLMAAALKRHVAGARAARGAAAEARAAAPVSATTEVTR